VSGLTQHGRARDDFGRWFGCDNSRPLLVYPHEERYLARNPHAASPPPTIVPAGDYDLSRVYPISRTLERFNNPDSAGHITSACGIGVYRDVLLGKDFADNTFTCEPVHNLVQRAIVEGDEANVTRRRDDGDADRDFLASTDNWCRPVQARTGPDGALYVVDMYRFLIEHPRWIPADRLAQLDVRAGADMGRIYRVRPSDQKLRPVRDLTKLSDGELATALDSPSGTERDRVHVELLARRSVAVSHPLMELATKGGSPAVRVQALAALDGIGALAPSVIEAALKDPSPQVRRHALRLAEPALREGTALLAAVLPLVNDR
jgi:hypothetical protein